MLLRQANIQTYPADCCGHRGLLSYGKGARRAEEHPFLRLQGPSAALTKCLEVILLVHEVSHVVLPGVTLVKYFAADEPVASALESLPNPIQGPSKSSPERNDI